MATQAVPCDAALRDVACGFASLLRQLRRFTELCQLPGSVAVFPAYHHLSDICTDVCAYHSEFRIVMKYVSTGYISFIYSKGLAPHCWL